MRLLFFWLLLVCTAVSAKDSLPSWRNGPTKTAILQAVARMTDASGPGYVPPAERFATFDNDGTLWPEQPLVEGMFMIYRIKAMVAQDPALAQRSPFKEVIQDAAGFFHTGGEKALLQVAALTHSGMTQEAFASQVRAFFAKLVYPKLNRTVRELPYRPMVELLELLRASGFKPYLCSGGTTDFLRVFSQELYGIAPEQVIGTSLKTQFRQHNGLWTLWRLPELLHFNDKDGKASGIGWQIGQRPAFAAGNVRSGGDIAMLTYSGSRTGSSFQLMVNHDDAAREFAYQEADGASLKASRAAGWTVVSMKDDWTEIFSP